MKRLLATLFSALLAISVAARDYTQLVDTRTGTNSRFELSRGNTYPATGRPFAVHLWSPQTGIDGNGWKYTYPAKEMRGFTLSHQCSPWTRDYASITLFPELGTPVFASAKRGARFDHSSEIAQPHYYKVDFKNGITTEMAPTDRCCHFRFQFPKGDDAVILVDEQRNKGNIEIDAANRQIRGYVEAWHHDGKCIKNYFIVQFNKPFADSGRWSEDGESGAYVRFAAGATVEARIGASYISHRQAALTMQQELGDKKSFAATKKEGQQVWNKLLGRIDVSGGTDEEIRTFYGCLFRANLFSRKFYEINADGNPYYFSPYDYKVHDGYMYTDNGFWDSYRAQFPLTNILHPTQQGRYMNAMLDAYDQFGWLPSWSFPGEQGGMLGNHSISLFADAWAKGIRTFDPERLLKAYIHEVSGKGPRGSANGRKGYQDYWKLGYVPYPEVDYGSAMTLEYAYDDYCGWQFAKRLGNQEWTDKFGKSMYNYRNVFCDSVGFMRGKNRMGEWTPDFRPGAWGGPFIEGNAWHYNWSVQHDIQGLINLYGSDKAFVEKLDALFATAPIIDFGFYTDIYNEMVEMVIADMGQYEHGNQPDHHAIYLYNYAGEPWKTQYWVREALRKLYNTSPDGYLGDEDQGSMSAWYVLSALGIYSVTPGTSEYVIGSPVFQKTVLTLEDGKKFTIEAANNSQENVYIQSATLNGNALNKNYIDYSDIANGGSLKFEMGSEPNKQRCTSKKAAPFSLSRPL